MEDAPLSRSPTELVDYASAAPPRSISYVQRFTHGSVTVSRCLLPPNPGIRLGSSQFTVAVHEGAPFDLEWRLAEGTPLQLSHLVPGDVHILPADELAFKRWAGTGRTLGISLDRRFVEQTVAEAFEGKKPTIRLMFGLRDPVIASMTSAWAQELAETGAAGRLFSEGLGVALAIHLFRTYGDRPVPVRPAKGGLGAARRRRVVDYIEANFADDISLTQLATVADLSRNHFGDAFRDSIGMPPYHYLIERRIKRAKELLLGSRKSIAEIALNVGFATHSHFTFNFRKVTGTTPSRFRHERS